MDHPRQRCILFAPRRSDGGDLPPLFGLHLVERTVLAFLRAGVREFVVTGDPDGARRVAAILRSGRCREARLRTLLIRARDSCHPCSFHIQHSLECRFC